MIDANTCDCNLMYKCTVIGSDTTVWQGSTFSCDNIDDGNLPLRHSQFANGSFRVKECNIDGTIIVAREVEVTGDSDYTSQLIIPVTPGIDNKTVECAHDNGATVRVISRYNLLTRRSLV